MRRHRSIILGLSLLTLTAAAPAAAQQSAQDASQEVADQFTQFVISQPYAQTLMQLIAAEEAKQGITDCEDKGSFARDRLWILEEIQFASESGPPTGGKWQDRLTVTHCGKTMTYNFLISAQNDGTPQIATLVPGNSNTDPQLQRKTVPLAIETASARAKELDPTLASCPDTWVKYAEFEKELSDDSAKLEGEAVGGWTETWNVEVCERTVPLQMTFLLYDSGKRAEASAKPID